MPGIVPEHPNAERDVARVARGPEQRELRHDELAVGVDLEDPLGPRRVEPTDHRGPVSCVPVGPLDVQPGPLVGEALQDRGSLVGRGVIDDEHLELLRNLGQRDREVVDELLDGPGLVEDRNDDGQIHVPLRRRSRTLLVRYPGRLQAPSMPRVLSRVSCGARVDSGAVAGVALGGVEVGVDVATGAAAERVGAAAARERVVVAVTA